MNKRYTLREQQDIYARYAHQAIHAIAHLLNSESKKVIQLGYERLTENHAIHGDALFRVTNPVIHLQNKLEELADAVVYETADRNLYEGNK